MPLEQGPLSAILPLFHGRRRAVPSTLDDTVGVGVCIGRASDDVSPTSSHVSLRLHRTPHLLSAHLRLEESAQRESLDGIGGALIPRRR